MLAAAWVLTYQMGGSKSVGPHLFYVSIILASATFGRMGAAVSAVVAGYAAGPMMPLDVAADTSQHPTAWLVRSGLFMLIGQLTAFLVGHSRSSLVSAARRRHVRGAIRDAMARGQLHVEYQPIIGLEAGKLVGVEALIRWHHPIQGPVPPAEFIPAVEDAGEAHLITAFILKESCSRLAHWRETGALGYIEGFKLAVNISATELNDPRLEDSVREVLQETGVPAGWLHLEVTETAVIADLERAVEGLQRLRGLGVRLAVDDFGTGESSLAYLHQLPIDVLKIDRSFLKSLTDDQRGLLVARCVVDLAKALSLRTVAEGVETVEQMEVLKDLGCDMAQGYLYSRPRSSRGIEFLLKEAGTGEARPGLARPKLSPGGIPVPQG